MTTIYESDAALDDWRRWLLLTAILKKVESGEMTEEEAMRLPGIRKAVANA